MARKSTRLPGWTLVAIVFLAGLAWAQKGAPTQQQKPRPIEEGGDKPQGQTTISVAVEQVRVDVTVQDKKGNLITGLSKDHFELYEDKVRQEITNFTPIEAPVTAVLLAEYSKVLAWEQLYEVWLSSQVFVQGMREGDWVAVVAYDIRPEILVDFTQSQYEVVNSLRKLNFPAFRESNLYDAIWDTLDRLQEVEGRTAIILISSGLDTFSKRNLGKTLDRVKRGNSVIYPVAVGGNQRARTELPTGLRMDLAQADATLKAFAKFTGGAAFFPRFTASYNSIFSSISALLRHQYSLSYVSSNTKKDGKYRKIRINVTADVDGDGKPDKLKVNYRDGYLAAEQ